MLKVLKILLRFGRPSAIIFAILAGTISGLCGTALLVLINRKLNAETASGDAAWMVWAFVGLCLAVPLSRILSGGVFIRLATRTARDLQIELSRSVLAAPLRQLEKIGPHRLLATVGGDTGAMADAVTTLPSLCVNAVVVLGCLVYLGWLSLPVLALVVVAIILGVISYELPMIAARKHQALAREQLDRMYDRYQSLTRGTKELKIHRPRRTAFLERLEVDADVMREKVTVSRMILTVANSWGNLLIFLVLGVLYFVAPRILPIERETLTGYTLVLLYMTGPLEVVLGTLPSINRAIVALGKIEKLGIALVETTVEEPMPADGKAPSWERLELRDVTHTYGSADTDDLFQLQSVNLVFRPNEIVFITGGNGSGKTTLAKILIGLYVPEAGEIVLDGKAITDADRERYHQAFSVVFSDFHLFSSLLGLEVDDLDQRAKDYLRALHLDSKVKVENGQLSTLELSQGQRKRLALLTAYLEDRPIYLFDEWAADQDPHFKEVFYRQLLPELKRRGKTVVVISHDDRYYPQADRLIRLESGTVSYDGAPLTAAWLSAEIEVTS